MRTTEVHAFDRTERRREWTAEGQIAQQAARRYRALRLAAQCRFNLSAAALAEFLEQQYKRPAR
ncbi:hypothetical protein CALCODRAFT_505172 [Calocera cornea HHB12733]|uniref:Uncharacterized protein n=1 Tax=Calocera cornea HHB12733 TaxID=1353952 RepID=A0A165AMS4_9BASI|nr:hypothetical protein CALCODRAFT_505172 [Calocera cornea HHB12733]